MPFKSKAQMKKCYAMGSKAWDCNKWAHETSSIKKLPARKKARKR